jgi:acyl-CoA synthetase (AMP-forming)/AMP-acid ligase II
MNILNRFQLHNSRIAVTDRYGTFTFSQLNLLASELAGNLKAQLRTADKTKRKPFSPQPCVAYFCPRDHTYVAAQWASWRAGAIGVPLAENYPVDDLRFILEDSGAAAVFSHSRCVDALRPAAEKAGVPIVLITEIRDVLNPSTNLGVSPPPPPLDIGEDALLIYTSGTTGRPKGVLVRHEVPSMILRTRSAWSDG